MVWTKLDDQFWCNPKIGGLSDRAFRLHVNALNWSTGNLTDGLIPEHMLAYYIRTGEASARTAAKELMQARLWHQVPLGFQINDYAEFQPTKQDVKARRKSYQERGAKGNHVRWHDELVDDCEWCEQDAVVIASTVATASRKGDSSIESPRPDPTRIEQQQPSEFEQFNLQRAKWEVERRIKSGLPVKSKGGLALTIAADEEHRLESSRVWGHRDCVVCGGSGSRRVYSTGGGGVLVDCDGSE